MSELVPVSTSVLAVSVTYGDRWSLLGQALRSAYREGVSGAIIVDNGARSDVVALAAQAFGDWATVIHLECNRGSAAGFAAGIKAACRATAGRILLLDDDNVLTQGALGTLVSALDEAEAESPIAAVFGLRAGHGEEQLRAEVAGRKPRLAGSVLEFHVADLPEKLLGRLRGRQELPAGALPATVDRTGGPYGGLLFSPGLIGHIGLPDERYVLYQDDTEFTRRIVRAGGRLRLVPRARIEDAEQSWHSEGRRGSAMRALLEAPSDFRVFYTVRNRTHLDHYRSEASMMRWVNSAAYFGLLTLLAARTGRWQRWRLLANAWFHGRREHLGVDPRFPLP